MTTAQEDFNGSFDDTWKENAICKAVDVEVFFNAKKLGEAKRICGRCPVKGECLEWALLTDQRFGVWGGLSEREMRRKYSPAVRRFMREDLN